MSRTGIRGEQLRDQTIEGIKIIKKTITNDHLSDNAQISEDKLIINWDKRNSDTLKSKKVLDYVDVKNTDVSLATFVNLDSIILSSHAKSDSNPDSNREGIIVESPLNKSDIVNSIDKGPIFAKVNGNKTGFEVYGRVTFINESFRLSFFYEDENKVEKIYIMENNLKIDWQYLRRISLEKVDQTFIIKDKISTNYHSASKVIENEDKNFISIREKQIINGYIHDQIFSSKSWIIEHNMEKYPSVSIVDTAGNLVVGNVEYETNNRIIVSFMSEFSGKAYLN